MYKFRFESYQIFHHNKTPDSTVEIQVADGMPIDDIIEKFRYFLLACGFSEKTVTSCFSADDYEALEE